MLKILPKPPEKGYNQNSALSRNQMTIFFNSLGVGHVSLTTVTRLVKLLKFMPKEPMPLDDIQQVFLLMAMKELYEDFSYEMLVRQFFTGVNKSHLNGYWHKIYDDGVVSRDNFSDKMITFYEQMKLNRKCMRN